MKTTLIVNPNAGGTNTDTVEQLEALLRTVGLDPCHRPTESIEDLEQVLQEDCEVVVAAGGDGTIHAVASQLAGTGKPLIIIPMGTANNIGMSLGITGNPASYLTPNTELRFQPFDLGVIQGPWGQSYFLEGVGLGLFANTMSAYDPEAGKSPLRAITAGIQTLREFEPKEFKVWLDGELVQNHIVLLEIMNTPAIGPRLRLAPDAVTNDGLFDVVMITPDQEVGFMAYATSMLQGQLAQLPNVNTMRCEQLSIEWDGSPLHLDGEIHEQQEGGRIEIKIWPGALNLWIPTVTESQGEPSSNQSLPTEGIS